MPKKKSRPFIDKKKSIVFHLVHRSQKDPLVAAEDKGLILAPVSGVERLCIKEKTCNADQGISSTRTGSVDPKTMEERIKYGIYFDDDYDYLKHLKDVNEVSSLEQDEEPLERYRIDKDGSIIEAGKDIKVPIDNKAGKLELPATLFESKGIELKTGLLNQAAPLPGPHPELDPDIVAALDDDSSFSFENPDDQLEDDFISKANAPFPSQSHDINRPFVSNSDVENEATDSEEDGWETDSDQGDEETAYNPPKRLLDYEKWSHDRHYYSSAGDKESNYDKNETRSRFTNYSLTSSVMRRSSGLKQVDAVFEKLYEQYDDEEIGELENDDGEITGFIKPKSDRVTQLVEEYERNLDKERRTVEELFNNKDVSNIDENEEVETIVEVCPEEKPREKWDCESIISTYSTLYNHPTLIVEVSKRKRARKSIDVDPKTGLPTGVFRSPHLGPTLAKLAKNAADSQFMDTDDRKTLTSSRASTVRSRFETTEERKARKSLIKAERKERRKEKKLNKTAFRSEAMRLNKQEINVKQNLTGIKLI